jgi:chromosome segregation ATPase
MITRFKIFTEALDNPINKEIDTLQQQLNLTLQKRDEVENKDTMGDVNKKVQEVKLEIQNVTKQKTDLENRLKQLELQATMVSPDISKTKEYQDFFQNQKSEKSNIEQQINNYVETLKILNQKLLNINNTFNPNGTRQ